MIPRIPQFFNSNTFFEPLYRLELPLLPLERDLLQSAPLRRLKHLHHYGAAAFVSPVTHAAEMWFRIE
jgi:HD superfamily phosphohydrolase